MSWITTLAKLFLGVIALLIVFGAVALAALWLGIPSKP